MKTRNTYLDIVKGITITLVVFAHCIQFGSGQEALHHGAHFENWLFKLIYTFHMPVFMLISGYLFFFSLRRHTYSENLSLRFTHLLLPVLIWQSLWIIVEHFLNWGMYPTIYSIISSYTCELWFLVSLFVNSTLILIIYHKFNSSKRIYLLFALFPLTLTIPFHQSTSLTIFMFPYFIIGYYFNKLNISKLFAPRDRKSLLLIVFLLLCFIFMYNHYNTEHYVYTTGTSIISNHRISIERIIIVLFRWIIGFVGSALFLLIVWWVHQLISLKLFTYLGTTSLGIYIISTYIFKLFYILPQIISSNLLINTLQCIIVLVISWSCSKLLSRHSLTKKLFLGG